MAEKNINIDLNHNENEIKNFSLEKLASDPTGFEGRIYLNTVSGNLRRYALGSWADVSGGVASSLPIISLTSNDNTGTFTEATPLVIPWNIESEKDSGFTHSNTTNNTRIIIDNDSTYQFGGALRIFNNSDQRMQPLPKILIDGVVQDIAVDSGYVRGAGFSSDYWSLEFTFRPLKLTANQYIEVQVGLESENPATFDGTLIGDESNFWAIKLQGAKGDKGDTGTGSNIVIQKDDSTVGTVTETLNFEGSGVESAIDEGSNKTTVTIINKIACCPFGAKSDSLGKFLIANGKSSDGDDSTKPKTRQPIGLDGTLTRLVYKTKEADSNTQMKIHINGTVEETVNLTNINGNFGGVETIDVDVVAGDYVEIEYDANQKCGECTMYFIEELT